MNMASQESYVVLPGTCSEHDSRGGSGCFSGQLFDIDIVDTLLLTHELT